MIVIARSDMDQIKSIRVGSEGKRYGGKEAGMHKRVNVYNVSEEMSTKRSNPQRNVPLNEQRCEALQIQKRT